MSGPTRQELQRRLFDLEEQLGEREDVPEDPTDLWRAFIEGELTLEEWKQSARQ